LSSRALVEIPFLVSCFHSPFPRNRHPPKRGVKIPFLEDQSIKTLVENPIPILCFPKISRSPQNGWLKTRSSRTSQPGR
jgi:hypothetical protein